MLYRNIELIHTTVDFLHCESDDLSTAYKASFRCKGNVNTNYIKKIIQDLKDMEICERWQLKKVHIRGDSIDRRAFLFLRKCKEKGLFEDFIFEFSDAQFPKPGLKLYFYVNGKIKYIGVDDAEYRKGDYFEIDELKEDMRKLYPGISDSKLVPFYVRNWVIFSSVPSDVEAAFAEYLDVISESGGKEKYAFVIKVRPNGTREYTKIQADENENDLSD